ncbi:hypothetical protein DH09_08870 [Bacillaceae bacterium JMAK1]|nr:hypothetical protein DH09_08870 [Bacillaceae bacterium JMAK1]
MIEMISDTEWFTFMLLLSQIALLGLQIRLFIEFAYVLDERHVHQQCYQSKHIEAHSLNPKRTFSIIKRKVPSLADHSSDDDEISFLHTR